MLIVAYFRARFRKKGTVHNPLGARWDSPHFAWVILLGCARKGTDTSSLGPPTARLRARFACVSPFFAWVDEEFHRNVMVYRAESHR